MNILEDYFMKVNTFIKIDASDIRILYMRVDFPYLSWNLLGWPRSPLPGPTVAIR